MNDSSRIEARWGGLLYVLAGSLAPFAYLYVPRTLLVRGDALATADRVRGAEGLLRAAAVAEVCSATLLIFAALMLHRLFKRVDPGIAAIMATMMLASVPVSFVNALSHVAPLVLLNDPGIAPLLGPGALAAQVTLFLRLHGYGLFVGQILWGLWLFPIGILVTRSGFIPRWLAFPLYAAGAGYVLHSLGTLLLPPAQRGFTEYLQVLGIGELPFFSFYLLIWGVRGRPADRPAAFLVLTMFAMAAVATALLMLGRIEPTTYGAIKAASLPIVVALVMRWRSELRAAARTAEVGA